MMSDLSHDGKRSREKTGLTQPGRSSGPSLESELDFVKTEGKKLSKEPTCHAWEPGQDVMDWRVSEQGHHSRGQGKRTGPELTQQTH